MSDNLNDGVTEAPEEGAPDELTFLKSRAKLMGIQHSNNISVDRLREKIQAKLAETTPPADDTEDGEVSVELHSPNPLAGDAAPVIRKMTLREYLIREELKLVRLRITNLNPNKKDLPGEIITIANEHIGTVRKYVPYGETTDEGYHVPHCIYTYLANRQFLNIRTQQRGGQTQVQQSWAKEFALEILPPLTTSELQKLAATQAAAGVFANE